MKNKKPIPPKEAMKQLEPMLNDRYQRPGKNKLHPDVQYFLKRWDHHMTKETSSPGELSDQMILADQLAYVDCAKKKMDIPLIFCYQAKVLLLSPMPHTVRRVVEVTKHLKEFFEALTTAKKSA